MKLIKDLIQELESLAPSSYQETYDNAGLIVGNPSDEITGVLVCLDSIETVIDEAIENNCNVVVAHHPIVFKGLKKINGKNYVERVIIKAIKHDIAIFAIHTNLDNVRLGVNDMFADKLGLTNRKILMPKANTLFKLSFYCPKDSCSDVLAVLHSAGAGKIGNYDHCNFMTMGVGSFRALEGADPYVGKQGEIHSESESKVDVVITAPLKHKMVRLLKEAHPYEEVAYFLQELTNADHNVGTGIIGELEEAMDSSDFLRQIKSAMDAQVIRHTAIVKDKIKKVAVVGGSGSFALSSAIRQNADILVSSDFKYHEFFDAENKIIIADIGHYESEQYTINLLVEYLKKKMPNFAVLFTKRNTNPVNYL